MQKCVKNNYIVSRLDFKCDSLLITSLIPGKNNHQFEDRVLKLLSNLGNILQIVKLILLI